jgi:hypothetical protein
VCIHANLCFNCNNNLFLFFKIVFRTNPGFASTCPVWSFGAYVWSLFLLDFHHIKVTIHVNLTIKLFFLVLSLFRVVDAHSIYWLHKVKRLLISKSDITRVIAFYNILVRESIHSFTYMFISPFSIYKNNYILGLPLPEKVS